MIDVVELSHWWLLLELPIVAAIAFITWDARRRARRAIARAEREDQDRERRITRQSIEHEQLDEEL